MEHKLALIKEHGVELTSDRFADSVCLGRGVKFEGDVVCSGALFVNGSVKGKIEAKKLCVVQEGVVDGNARVSSAQIEGMFRDRITASGLIHLAATAQVEGQLNCAEIEIAQGAIVNATISSSKRNR